MTYQLAVFHSLVCSLLLRFALIVRSADALRVQRPPAKHTHTHTHTHTSIQYTLPTPTEVQWNYRTTLPTATQLRAHAHSFSRTLPLSSLPRSSPYIICPRPFEISRDPFSSKKKKKRKKFFFPHIFRSCTLIPLFHPLIYREPRQQRAGMGFIPCVGCGQIF